MQEKRHISELMNPASANRERDGETDRDAETERQRDRDRKRDRGRDRGRDRETKSREREGLRNKFSLFKTWTLLSTPVDTLVSHEIHAGPSTPQTISRHGMARSLFCQGLEVDPRPPTQMHKAHVLHPFRPNSVGSCPVGNCCPRPGP